MDARGPGFTWVETMIAVIILGWVMHYIELDVHNLCCWFRGTMGASGGNAVNTTGYVAYFSDRRTNRNATNQETEEYGFEDFVNPMNVNGTPDGLLDTAEDVNGNGVLDAYGQTPIMPVASPLDSNAHPWSTVAANVARINRPIFTRLIMPNQ